MIKIEKIKGKLILLGADDDSFWEAGKYVRRMDQRLKERPHECEYEAVAYRYGTHFVLPESMLRMALPVGLKFVMRLIFRSAKEHPDECEATRKDVAGGSRQHCTSGLRPSAMDVVWFPARRRV